MEEQNSNHQWWLYALLFGAFLLLSLRFLVVLRFLLVPLLALAALGAGGYWLWKYMRDKRRAKVYRNSVEGIIETRLQHCDVQIAYNQEQIQEITANVRELEDKLKAGSDVAPRIREETENLIQSFQSEMQLRESKLAFFETCKRRLEQMLHQHQLSRALEEKKEKLRSLQENHYEELAEMEELRTNVEMEIMHLDTIENLSQRILQSSSYNDAERLRRELNDMTESLDKM